jgi:hypothetical protein
MGSTCVSWLSNLCQKHCHQDKLENGEYSLQQLVDVSAETWGWENSKLISYMIKLEKCFLRQEKHGEAEKIRLHRLAVARKLGDAA